MQQSILLKAKCYSQNKKTMLSVKLAPNAISKLRMFVLFYLHIQAYQAIKCHGQNKITTISETCIETISN